MQDAVEIGQDMKSSFASSLPGRFHHPIKKTVKTMQVLKRGVKVSGINEYDLEAVFAGTSILQTFPACALFRTFLTHRRIWLHQKREQGNACKPAWCYGQNPTIPWQTVGVRVTIAVSHRLAVVWFSWRYCRGYEIASHQI